MAHGQRWGRQRRPAEKSFLIALAIFVMICGGLLVALPRSATPPEEAPSCIDAEAVRRGLSALEEAELAIERGDQARTGSKLQSARQALTDALAP